MATSEKPHIMCSAACAMACKPDEQKRLIVIADDELGNPANSAAWRAIFIPCWASGVAQPMTTSSTSSGLTSGARAINSLITLAAMSSGRVSFSEPRGALPTAVRNALTITASRICFSPFTGKVPPSNYMLIPQRLACLQHVRDAFLSGLRPAQTDEGFALQVEQVLLRHARRARQVAAAQHRGDLQPDQRVVV